MRKLAILILMFCACSGLFAASEIADFAQRYEESIQTQIESEKILLRRHQKEFLYRQSYSNSLLRKRDVMLRSGKLTTEKVEALRAERNALIEQLNALDKKIEEASLEAPEIAELQAIIKANNDRIEELRQSIMPNTAPPAQPDAELN